MRVSAARAKRSRRPLRVCAGLALLLAARSSHGAEVVPAVPNPGWAEAALVPLAVVASGAALLGSAVVQGIADDEARGREVRQVSGYDAPPAGGEFESGDYGRYRDELWARDPYAEPHALIDLVRRGAARGARGSGERVVR